MRALKFVGIAVGALLVLLAIGVALVAWWVDPNDYRDDIERLVQQKTGRPLRIGGEIDLKFFPRLALRIGDVSLGNPPGYGEQPFLAVKSASVGVRLVPLLHQRLEVSRVAVDGLAVTLISRGEEDNNWKDLGESSAQESPQSGESSAELSIAGVDVTDSVLVYRDEAEKSLTRLSRLEVHTGALGGEEPMQTQATFDLEQAEAGAGEPKPVAHVVIDTLLKLPGKDPRLELKELALRGNLHGEKKPMPFSVSTPSLLLDMDAESLEPVTLNVELGELPIKVTATGQKLFSEMSVAGDVSVPQVSLRKLMPSFGMEVPNTSDANALTRFALKTRYRLLENQVRLADLDLLLDETHVRGIAAVEDLEKMALTFDLDVDRINVDRYLEPKAEGPKAEGKQAQQAAASAKSAEEPTELPVDALRKLNMNGVLKVGSARVTDLDFTKVRLPVEAQGGRVHLGPTRAQLFGGGYEGDITLDARQSQARLSLDEHVRNIDMGALMKGAFDTDRVVGRGNANAVLTATGNTDAAIFRTLSGRIDVDVKDGAFSGVDLWYELRRAWAVVKRQTLPARDNGPPRTAFKTLTGNATLDNGVMNNRELRIDLDYLKANGNGTLDLSTKAVDYRLVAEVYKLPPEGDSVDMSELKAAEIPISITGTLDNMKVRPDVEKLIGAKVRQEVTERVQEKKEDLKKKLEERLKDLLGN